jgi:PHD/YefM family antitoxin component YafN of YafNO toxin-antitoxin module
MRIDVLSVREAREQLPSVLDRFRQGDRTPVFLGSHRKTEAVIMSIDVYEELVARRRDAVAQAEASVRAEGGQPSPQAKIIIDEWVHGHISADEMEERIVDIYRPR